MNEGADSIGDFKVLHEADGVMLSTHIANFGHDVWLVMYCVKEENGELLEWTINGGPVENN